MNLPVEVAAMQTKTLHDTDFNLWLLEQLTALREGHFEAVDWKNVLEELESLGISQRTALKSYLTVALMHMLKWQLQPEKRSKSWVSSILRSQSEILLILEDSPSLKNYIPEAIAKAYVLARREASKETRKPIDQFPAEPCTFSQVMEWEPED